jgi:hypothetical protein
MHTHTYMHTFYMPHTADGHDARRVGWAFFWQAPGAMAPYLVALALLGLHDHGKFVCQYTFMCVHVCVFCVHVCVFVYVWQRIYLL